MVVSRIVSALLMAFIVGIVMSFTFRREESKRAQEFSKEKTRIISGKDLLLLVLIVITLLSPNYLIQKGPYLHKVIVWFIASMVMFFYAFKVKPFDEIKTWFLGLLLDGFLEISYFSLEVNMKIEVVGPGCARCIAVEKNLQEAVKQLGFQAEIIKITDVAVFAKKGVMFTPGVIVDGQVKFSGKIPSVAELKEILTDNK